MANDIELFLVIFIGCVCLIAFALYLTRTRKNPMDTTPASSDPSDHNIPINLTIHDVGRGKTVRDVKVVTRPEADSNGDFEGQWQGSNGILRASTQNMIPRFNQQAVEEGEWVVDFYANGPKEGYMRDNVRLRDENSLLTDLVGGFELTVKEAHLTLDTQMQLAVQKWHRLRREGSVQGYRQFDNQQQKTTTTTKKKVTPKTTTTNTDQGGGGGGDAGGPDWTGM